MLYGIINISTLVNNNYIDAEFNSNGAGEPNIGVNLFLEGMATPNPSANLVSIKPQALCLRT
jgi:hypothetical protein